MFSTFIFCLFVRFATLTPSNLQFARKNDGAIYFVSFAQFADKKNGEFCEFSEWTASFASCLAMTTRSDAKRVRFSDAKIYRKNVCQEA